MPQIRKQIATPIFNEIIVLFENFYNPLMVLHPTSPCIWKSDQVLESYSQFSIFGPNASNKEIECHVHLLWNYCFIWKLLESFHDSASNEPLDLSTGSGTWKLQPIFYFCSPNASNKEIKCQIHFLESFYFVLQYLQSSYNSVSNEALVLKIGPEIRKLWNFSLDFRWFALPEWLFWCH